MLVEMPPPSESEVGGEIVRVGTGVAAVVCYGDSRVVDSVAVAAGEDADAVDV